MPDKAVYFLDFRNLPPATEVLYSVKFFAVVVVNIIVGAYNKYTEFAEIFL